MIITNKTNVKYLFQFLKIGDTFITQKKDS